MAIFLSHVRELLDSYLLRYFFILFFFFFVFFWYPSSSNVGAFNVVLEVSETVFFSFGFLYSAMLQLFTLFCLPDHLFIHSLTHSSSSLILLL